MSGHKVPGTARFAAKEGVNFDCRLNIYLHSDELAQVDTLKRSGESRADYIRAALREKMLRDFPGTAGGRVSVRTEQAEAAVAFAAQNPDWVIASDGKVVILTNQSTGAQLYLHSGFRTWKAYRRDGLAECTCSGRIRFFHTVQAAARATELPPVKMLRDAREK